MATEVDIEVDPRTLILEVKNHPVIYDKHAQAMGSMLKVCKSEEWKEVGANIVDGWSDFSTFDQHHIIKSLQAKWKNIRDSYMKDLKNSKKPVKKKSRPYIFSDILSFLNPNVQKGEYGENSTETTFVELEEDIEEEYSSEDSNVPLNNIKKEYLDKEEEESHKSTEETPQTSVVRTTKRRHPVDEDEYFLLSLLPTFHRMTEGQKFEARMEILSVLKRIRQS